MHNTRKTKLTTRLGSVLIRLGHYPHLVILGKESRARVVGFLLSRTGRVFVLILVALVLGVFLLQTFRRAGRFDGIDYLSYLLSAQALLDGTDPYQTGSPFQFIYPLFLCVLLIPLSAIPFGVSLLLWSLGSLVALVYSAFLVAKHYSADFSSTSAPAVFFLPFFFLADVIQNNLLNGQVNFLVLLLCMLFLGNLLASRKILASICLATAIAIKLTPLVYLVYLVIRKEFSSASLTILLSLVFIFFVPCVIGGSETIEYSARYYDSFIIEKLSSGSSPAMGFDYSISSIVRYLLPSLPGVLSFSIASVLALFPIVWRQVKSEHDKSSQREIHLFALYMLAILLINPMSETHHLIQILPALIVISMRFMLGLRFASVLVTFLAVLASLVAARIDLAFGLIAILVLYVSIALLLVCPDESPLRRDTVKKPQ